MKKDPCETCLVRACCIIPKYIVWWKCGCDPYEAYKIWQLLYNHCSKNDHLTNLMFKNSPRMKQLKERYQ